MKEIAPDLALIPLKIANVYLIGKKSLWFLVDSGLAGESTAIKKAVAERFGDRAKPAGIVLTHGHQDHAGSAQALSDEWSVPVYAPRLEMPFLSGRSEYPKLDPTAPGFLAFLSRFVTPTPITVTRLLQLDEANPFPGLTGWQAVPTPGHSPGHVAYFRPSDGVLLAGDAFTTMDTESLTGVLTKKRKLCRPPAPSTIDWLQAKQSVARLAGLQASLLAPGHGKPMLDTGTLLKNFSNAFQIPERGRYAQTPVRLAENGALVVPPEPPDLLVPIGKSVLVAAAAVGLGAAYSRFKGRLPRRP